jgi:heptosyltransferase I
MLDLARPPQHICIFRLSALGDATHVVPVVRALRKKWPDASLTWIIGKLEYKLLRGLEGVEFIVFDKRGGWPAIKALRKQLHNRRFDVLLHMQVAIRANLLSRLVSAPIRLGWDRPRSRDRHHWFINTSIRSVPFQHQVEGFLEFAGALGADTTEPVWDLPYSQADRDWVRQQLPGEEPVLLISPCSSHPLRNWPAKNLARVADHAAASLGMQVVLTGGPSQLEQQTGAEILSAMKQPALNLIGQDTLKQSIALLKRADLLISPDAGPTHIASAVGTAVVGLHAATWARRSGPYNSIDLCVDRFPEAARKFRNKEPQELRWGTRIEMPGVMDLIRSEDVIEALESIALKGFSIHDG